MRPLGTGALRRWWDDHHAATDPQPGRFSDERVFTPQDFSRVDRRAAGYRGPLATPHRQPAKVSRFTRRHFELLTIVPGRRNLSTKQRRYRRRMQRELIARGLING